MIDIAIGSEPDQRIPALVLAHSIRIRSSRPTTIFWSWDPLTKQWHPEAERFGRMGGTNFSNWRWVAPSVARALPVPPERLIYLDCDQVVLADISELHDALPEGKDFAMVVSAEGWFGAKVPDPGARETSVMVMRLAAADWDFADLSYLVEKNLMQQWARKRNPRARGAKSSYSALMQATWIADDQVHELPKGWNHMNHRDGQTKLVHFTHVRSQPWKAPGHALMGLWASHLRVAVADGVVTWAMVEEEVQAGHIDPFWLGFVQEGTRGGA